MWAYFGCPANASVRTDLPVCHMPATGRNTDSLPDDFQLFLPMCFETDHCSEPEIKKDCSPCRDLLPGFDPVESLSPQQVSVRQSRVVERSAIHHSGLLITPCERTLPSEVNETTSTILSRAACSRQPAAASGVAVTSRFDA